MAYNVRKIQPVDLEGRKIIGVKLPFGGNYSSTYENYRKRETDDEVDRSSLYLPTRLRTLYGLT